MTTYTNGITRAEFIAECEAHRAADRYMDGDYWRPDLQRGCAVGYAVQTVNQRLRLSPQIGSNDHAGLARALGWPVWLVRIQDVVFEQLPVDQRADWPVNLAIAVPENVDLEPVLSRINARILREMVLPIAGTSADVVERVANGLETDWVNDDPDAAADAADAAADAADAADAAGAAALAAGAAAAARAATWAAEAERAATWAVEAARAAAAERAATWAAEEAAAAARAAAAERAVWVARAARAAARAAEAARAAAAERAATWAAEEAAAEAGAATWAAAAERAVWVARAARAAARETARETVRAAAAAERAADATAWTTIAAIVLDEVARCR